MIKTKESALEEEEKSIIMMISRTENLIVTGQRKCMKGEVNINAHTRKICLSKLLTASLHNNAYRKGQSVTKSLSFNQHFRLRDSHCHSAHEQHLTFLLAWSACIEQNTLQGALQPPLPPPLGCLHLAM